MNSRTSLVLVLVTLAIAGASARVDRAAAVPQGSSSWCAGALTWSQARARVGRVVKLKAVVAGAKYAASSNGQPTFIDLGRRYPNPGRLTLLIWGRSRVNFPTAPERMFRGGTTVCARGRVSLYRGVPEIELSRWNASARMLVS